MSECGGERRRKTERQRQQVRESKRQRMRERERGERNRERERERKERRGDRFLPLKLRATPKKADWLGYLFIHVTPAVLFQC